jgi:hypothetical protein
MSLAHHNRSAHLSYTDPAINSQQQLREDWDNRETIQIISHHIQKITDFLNQFGKLGETFGKNQCSHFLQI